MSLESTEKARTLCYEAHKFLTSHCFDRDKIVDLLSYATVGICVIEVPRESIGNTSKEPAPPEVYKMLEDFDKTRTMLGLLTDLQIKLKFKGDSQ